MKPYYYVYDTKYKQIIGKYDDLCYAQMNAEEMAVIRPGDSFEILQCLGISQVAKARTFWADGVPPM